MVAQVGQTISVTVNVRDSDGALADVTTCTGVFRQPDGTDLSGTVVHGPTGVYTMSATTAQAGKHYGKWTATGPNSAGLNARSGLDVVDVWPADPRFLVSLAEARDALNFGANNATHDDELLLFIAAATSVIEDIVGPVLVASRTQTCDGGKTTIQLYERAAAITSITENGTPLTSDDYVLDDNSGVIYRGSSIAQFPWFPGKQNVVVTYTVGSSVIDPAIVRAAALEIRYLYASTQQGNPPPQGQDFGALGQTPSGIMVPQGVLALCSSGARTRLPGVG